MSNKTKNAFYQVIGTAYSESILDGHQVIAIRVNRKRPPAWTQNDEQVRAVLLRSFPKMHTDRVHRKRAGTWMRFIHLYWRYRGDGGSMMSQRFVEPNKVYTQRDIAKELKITLAQLKSLRTRIVRAGKGLPTDGRAARLRRPRASSTPQASL
jgi:hypothetical protein